MRLVCHPISVRSLSSVLSGELPPAIPQIQRQIPHELDMAVFHVNRGPQPPHILGDVVAEDNRPHRRLARAALPHQQHLSLLLARVHRVDAVWGTPQARSGLRGMCCKVDWALLPTHSGSQLRH